MCGNASESVTHITSACQKLAQTQYKHRHDKVGKKIHWLLSKKYNLECTDKWYQHSPESVAENEEVKILWDFMIQTDRVIEHRRPDIVVVEKIGGKCFIIDIAVPGDHNVQQKELEKKTKYEDLRIEIARLWNKEVSVIPVVVGALGTLTANLKKKTEEEDRRRLEDLIKAASMVVAENIGMDVRKKNANRSDRKEPWWKRRRQESTKTILKDISVPDRKAKGELRNQQKYRALSRKHHIARKGLKVVTEELKQRLIAKKAKLMRYDQRIEQYEQNRLYRVDQKRFYHEINGERTNEAVIPDSDESQKFWSDIWSNEIEHKEDAEWLQELKETTTSPKQAEIEITVTDVKEISKKMSNWTSPGPDGVQGYWIKRFSECHIQKAEQLNNLLSDDQVIPEWLTKGRTVLCLKDIANGNAVDNYRPISCLPLMWKLLTGIIGLKKCGVLVLKRGKAKQMNGLVLPTGDVVK